jgi:putative membrane protein
MANKAKFSEEDLKRIESTVKEAESKIMGEIVPVYVKQSDSYPEALPNAFIFGFLLTAGLILIADLFFIEWGKPIFSENYLYFFMITLLGGFFCYILAKYVSFIRYFFIDYERMNYCVDLQARKCFLEYEVFNTQLRNGILLYVSEFEHEVEILGDSGINKKVNSAEWQLIADAMIKHLKKKRKCEAFIEGINKSCDLLIKHGFRRIHENENELSDNLRIKSI